MSSDDIAAGGSAAKAADGDRVKSAGGKLSLPLGKVASMSEGDHAPAIDGREYVTRWTAGGPPFFVPCSLLDCIEV